MYLILDSNITSEFVDIPSADALAILDWIRTTGKAATGGQLRREYLPQNNGNRKFLRLFLAWNAAGRAVMVPDSEVDAVTELLKNNAHISSNDHHVIALATVSGARAIWTRDRALRADFQKKTLLDKPRGKCYNPDGNARRRQAGIAAISKVARD